MSQLNAITWAIAGAGGFTAYALLAAAVALGLALSLHWQSPRWPRLINSELHNFLTLLAALFTGLHVLAVWIDPFTHFGWSEVLLPFVSHYRPLWMACGIVALYLGIAIGVSTWLRPKIGYTLWRRLHVLTFAVYALTTVHGIVAGSNTGAWWAIAIYGCSIVLIGALLLLRFLGVGAPRSPARPARATGPRAVAPTRIVEEARR
jgi:predicted ferric reductase